MIGLPGAGPSFLKEAARSSENIGASFSSGAYGLPKGLTSAPETRAATRWPGGWTRRHVKYAASCTRLSPLLSGASWPQGPINAHSGLSLVLPAANVALNFIVKTRRRQAYSKLASPEWLRNASRECAFACSSGMQVHCQHPMPRIGEKKLK